MCRHPVAQEHDLSFARLIQRLEPGTATDTRNIEDVLQELG
jgi:hypothetical protein